MVTLLNLSVKNSNTAHPAFLKVPSTGLNPTHLHHCGAVDCAQLQAEQHLLHQPWAPHCDSTVGIHITLVHNPDMRSQHGTWLS